MTPSASSTAPDDFVGTLSWPQELECLAGTLRNYVDSELRLHRRHGHAFRSRLPIPTLNLAHPRHLHRILRTHVLDYLKSGDYDFLRPLQLGKKR